MRNADHRLKESTIQSASLPCALSGRGGICQVKTVANVFWGAWNTDKENQVWRMRADLDRNNCDTLLRLHAIQKKHKAPWICHTFPLVLNIMRKEHFLLLTVQAEQYNKEQEHLETELRKWMNLLIHTTHLFFCTDLYAVVAFLCDHCSFICAAFSKNQYKSHF